MKNIMLLLLFLFFISRVTAQETGTFTDERDDKVYKTITIGKQTWMAQNLAYKAVNGCWAYNNADFNVIFHGYLYDWATAKASCPKGWHLPSDAEWKVLSDHLGGEALAGHKLKSTEGWMGGFFKNGSNETGFNAIPSGCYVFEYKIYTGFEGITAWWSSTLDDTPLTKKEKKAGRGAFAWNRYLMFSSLDRKHDSINDGLSVRCIKD